MPIGKNKHELALWQYVLCTGCGRIKADNLPDGASIYSVASRVVLIRAPLGLVDILEIKATDTDNSFVHLSTYQKPVKLRTSPYINRQQDPFRITFWSLPTCPLWSEASRFLENEAIKTKHSSLGGHAEFDISTPVMGKTI